MRPVELYAVTHRYAEELVHRHPERLGLDVPERQLNASDRFVRSATQVLTKRAQHVPVQSLDSPRVLADEQALEVSHRTRHAVRISAVAALAPADDAGIGFDFHERPRPP